MYPFTPKGIFDRALSSPLGIEIVLDDPASTKNVRRRLYAERERLRQSGIHEYDELSFLIRHHEVWIVRRDKIASDDAIALLDCRPLNAQELPGKILSRGKSHTSLYIS